MIFLLSARSHQGDCRTYRVQDSCRPYLQMIACPSLRQHITNLSHSTKTALQNIYRKPTKQNIQPWWSGICLGDTSPTCRGSSNLFFPFNHKIFKRVSMESLTLLKMTDHNLGECTLLSLVFHWGAAGDYTLFHYLDWSLSQLGTQLGWRDYSLSRKKSCSAGRHHNMEPPDPNRVSDLSTADIKVKLETDCHSSPSISFMKASYTSSLVCTETGAEEPTLGVALVIWTEGSSSGFLWAETAVPLFSRRTRRAVGTKRVISALGFVICGLALIVAVAFFSMVAALVSSALGRWIKLGGALSTPGFGMGAGGNIPGGGTRGGRNMPGRGGGIPVWDKHMAKD